MAVETGLMTLHEDELKGIMQMLAQIARTSEGSDQKLDSQPFQSRLSTLPRRARFTVSQALSALAAQAPSDSSDKPTLLKLAEHIAIRFAMESYERGDIEVNAVRQVLDEMSQELDSLRKIMGVYEEKMARHGIEVQSHTDMLAQQFWAQVPVEKRKAVLESAEAWCVPPAQIRSDSLSVAWLSVGRGAGRAEPPSSRSSARIVAPEASSAARSTAFSSSRTLPGQS